MVPDGNSNIFASKAEDVVRSIVDAIIVDCQVEIAASFGLNLNKVFDENAPIADRLPQPFLQITTFDITGEFGLKEWSDYIPFSDLGMTFGISVSLTHKLIGNLPKRLESIQTHVDISFQLPV